VGLTGIDSTVQIDKGRFAYLDAVLVDATDGTTGEAGATASTATVRYKKPGDFTLTTKALNTTTTTLSLAAASGATAVTLADSSAFPPTGKLTITPDGGVESAALEYTANNVSSNTITLSAALGTAYVIGGTVKRLDFFELGTVDGYYTILFTPSELDTLGPFTYFVEFAGAITSVRTIDLVIASGVDTEAAPSADVCIVKDHIIGLDGNPAPNISVSARLLSLPMVSQSSGVVDRVVSTKTDTNGFFQLSLLQDATVDITISEIGYRRTILVPCTTLANLFEIA